MTTWRSSRCLIALGAPDVFALPLRLPIMHHPNLLIEPFYRACVFFSPPCVAGEPTRSQNTSSTLAVVAKKSRAPPPQSELFRRLPGVSVQRDDNAVCRTPIQAQSNIICSVFISAFSPRSIKLITVLGFWLGKGKEGDLGRGAGS